MSSQHEGGESSDPYHPSLLFLPGTLEGQAELEGFNGNGTFILCAAFAWGKEESYQWVLGKFLEGTAVDP